MTDGQPFGIGGLWESWKDPNSGEWIRTFAVVTNGRRAPGLFLLENAARNFN